jgi:restriction system protein
MARKSEGMLLELVELPWWASVIMAVVIYAGLRWFVPFAAGSTPTGVAIGKIATTVAPWFGLLFLLPAPFAAVRAWMDGRLLAKARGSQAIRSIPWHEFERLVAIAYRRLGYQVEKRGGAGADGGVDLVLREAGKTTLVQCKHWNRQQVGVPIVRELFGVMDHELADAGIIVTGGAFTAEAEAFARGKSIELLNGAKLAALLNDARGEVSGETAGAVRAPTTEPSCPKCGAAMVRRTARRGANAGSDFWGCSTYPGCKGTRPI